MDGSDTMIRGLVRRWPMILLTMVIAMLAAYWFSQSQPDQYRSTTRLVVGPTTGAPVETLRSSGLMAHTYADLVLSESNLRSAAAAAGLEIDLEELTEMVDVRANETTRTLTIGVQHDDPRAGAAFASALVDRVIMSAPLPTAFFDPNVQGSQEDGPDDELPAGMVTVVDDATTNPPEPVEQPTSLLVLLAGVVAAGIAATAAIALESAPWRRPPANLEGLLQRRFLGRVALRPTGPGAPLLSRRTHQEAVRDQRLITTKLQHLTAGSQLRSLSVFGARADNGSALVAAELATTFASDGHSVVLVDLTGDPKVARRLQLGRLKRDVVTVDDVVLELAEVEMEATGSLRTLVSDAVRASEELPKARHVVELLGDIADLVVVVAPAMLLEFGTLLVAKRTDGALLVGGEDESSVDGLIEAFDLLRAYDVPILGTVVASRHAAADHPSFASRGTPASSAAISSRSPSVEDPTDLAPGR